MAASPVACPVCRRHDCPARLGKSEACAPPVERRKAQGDPRRGDERRFFPRPEGRRRGAGRRLTDPVE